MFQTPHSSRSQPEQELTSLRILCIWSRQHHLTVTLSALPNRLQNLCLRGNICNRRSQKSLLNHRYYEKKSRFDFQQRKRKRWSGARHPSSTTSWLANGGGRDAWLPFECLIQRGWGERSPHGPLLGHQAQSIESFRCD